MIGQNHGVSYGLRVVDRCDLDERLQLTRAADAWPAASMGVAANTPTTEYEVRHVSAGHLYFGARPVDGQPLATPEDRPTTLQMPLKRLSGGMTQKVGADDLRVPKHVEIVLFEQADGAETPPLGWKRLKTPSPFSIRNTLTQS